MRSVKSSFLRAKVRDREGGGAKAHPQDLVDGGILAGSRGEGSDKGRCLGREEGCGGAGEDGWPHRRSEEGSEECAGHDERLGFGAADVQLLAVASYPPWSRCAIIWGIFG